MMTASVSEVVATASGDHRGARVRDPRSTPQNRPVIDGAKPANAVGASRRGRDYRVASSQGKGPRPLDGEKAACGCP